MKSWFDHRQEKTNVVIFMDLSRNKFIASVCRRKARRLPANKLWPSAEAAVK